MFYLKIAVSLHVIVLNSKISNIPYR